MHGFVGRVSRPAWQAGRCVQAAPERSLPHFIRLRWLIAALSLSVLLPLSRSLGLELNAVPLLDLFGENLVHHLMLLDDWQALELLGHNVESIHATATTADVLDLHGG